MGWSLLPANNCWVSVTRDGPLRTLRLTLTTQSSPFLSRPRPKDCKQPDSKAGCRLPLSCIPTGVTVGTRTKPGCSSAPGDTAFCLVTRCLPGVPLRGQINSPHLPFLSPSLPPPVSQVSVSSENLEMGSPFHGGSFFPSDYPRAR